MTHNTLWKRFNHRMEILSEAVMAWSGTTGAIVVAFLVVLCWLVTGPIFGFSDTWQLVINTATTIATFLMVFLIQRAQNKADRAMSLKLNELIAAVEGSSNRLIDVEELSEDELEVLRQHYRTLVAMAKRDTSLTKSHSVEEAETRHTTKLGRFGQTRKRRTG